MCPYTGRLREGGGIKEGPKWKWAHVNGQGRWRDETDERIESELRRKEAENVQSILYGKQFYRESYHDKNVSNWPYSSLEK